MIISTYIKPPFPKIIKSITRLQGFGDFSYYVQFDKKSRSRVSYVFLQFYVLKKLTFIWLGIWRKFFFYQSDVRCKLRKKLP